MSTYRELTYLVSDLVKTISDDTIINENHIMFLLNKYRTYLLKQKYENTDESKIPSSNYQTVCIDLELKEYIATPESGCSDSCVCSVGSDKYLRSKKELPETINLGSIKVTGNNYVKDLISIVSNERFEYVGYNNWLQNIIYGTVERDRHLYLKSNNQAFLNMKKVHLTAIFDDPLKATEQYKCEDEGGESCPIVACDEMDREFPLEDALITQLLSLVIKEVIGAAWRPADQKNNAADDLADLANFVRNYMKKDYRTTTE